jgi:hypothetical protein
MSKDISSLTLEQLQLLYSEVNSSLLESLLNGADWEEVRDERIKLTCIAREIHHRKYPLRQEPSNNSFLFNY